MLPALYNNLKRIVQTDTHVMILAEMVHDARVIRLNSTHRPDDVRTWMGDSIGHWEGDTLVVETKNFNGLTQSFGVYGTSKDKLLTERFTRTGPFTVEYEFTVDDPSTFKDKIVAMVPMAKVDGQLYEYACHEGNYGMVNILRGERMSELRDTEASP